MADATFLHCFCGINVSFPYPDPYPAQRVIMANAICAFSRKQNGLLESPTGTGKSLALLASALAYQSHTAQAPSFPDDDSDAPTTRVWYTSRTHTQLKQLVHELKRLPYTPRMVVLAARRRLCVYEPVSRSANVEMQCKAERVNCPYAQNGSAVPPGFDRGKFDIQELIEYCRNNMRCPFLISRELMKSAELILSPYNYIIDPAIRSQMNLQLDRAIIIMDEAHNIENSCREAAAFQLTSDELAHVRAELHRAIVTPSEEGQWLSWIKQPLWVVDEVIALMSSWFEERRQYFDGGSEVVPEVDDLTTWASWKVNSRTFPALSAALRELTKVDKASGSRLPDRLVVKLNQFASTLRLVFGSNGMKLRDFRIVYKHTSDAKSDQLLILCLNPGVVFSPVAQASHSLILSSGTLSPLDSFASELGAPFDIQVSANHVIDPCQMCPMVLPALDSGFRFSSAHSQLANSDYRSRLHTVLGETFERLLRVIPGGVLFFVPSHDFLRRLVEHWKFSRIYQAISEIKPIFVEKPGGGEELLARFKKSIESGRGGFLMGVCRGTTSEGMDFTDDQARAVFVFGIPYPNYADIDVQLKKAYNDRYAKGFSNRKLLSSHDWYDAQAFRALAQAVGRCIRHKSDYGAVVLIDERFVNQSHNFPPWVRRGISTKSNLDDVAAELRSFFAAMTQRFPVTPSTAIDVELPSSFNCAGCGAKIMETYRFDPHQVYLVDRQGFLEIVESDHPMQVLAVPESSRRELVVPTPSEFWSTQDSICYKPIVCLCGTAVGTYLFAVSWEDAQFLDSFWMIIERLTISQGSNQQSISSIIVDACFDSVDDE